MVTSVPGEDGEDVGEGDIDMGMIMELGIDMGPPSI